MLRTLTIEWEKLVEEIKESIKGEIKTIIQDGRVGFIKSEEGNDYYFKVISFKGEKKIIEPGLKVKFYLENSFDKKRNRNTKIGANIIPIT